MIVGMSATVKRGLVLCTASAALAAGVTIVLAEADTDRARRGTPVGAVAEVPKGVREDCSTRSEGSFPHPFRNPDNLVIGPLSLVGGARAAEDPWIRKHDWQKFPLLVKASRIVTVRLTRRTRRFARLAYGPLPEGNVRFRDAHHTVKFVACQFNEPSFNPGEVVGRYTFWSGSVMVQEAPACVPLEVYVGHRSRPHEAMLSMDAGHDCEIGGASKY